MIRHKVSKSRIILQLLKQKIGWIRVYLKYGTIILLHMLELDCGIISVYSFLYMFLCIDIIIYIFRKCGLFITTCRISFSG